MERFTLQNKTLTGLLLLSLKSSMDPWQPCTGTKKSGTCQVQVYLMLLGRKCTGEYSTKLERLGNCNKKFVDVFWHLWRELELQLPEDTTKCYIFELLTSMNVIVVRPKKDELVLHGCRCLKTLNEIDPLLIAEQVRNLKTK